MKKIRKINILITTLILSITTLTLLSGCSSCNDNNDSTPPETHVCAQCNKTTTDFKKYETDNGTELYYCEKCSKTCAICGGEASKHYTNALDQIVFVCKDCYKNINSDD